MTLTIAPGRTVKHFDAYDVFAKWTVAKPYAHATAANAADFLEKVAAEMPWPIKAIQIDGGSEFMAEFETTCQEKEIPLYVLPPRSPKLNGAVERCKAPGDTNSTVPPTCRRASTRSLSMSTPSSISTTIIDRMEPSTASHQAST